MRLGGVGGKCLACALRTFIPAICIQFFSKAILRSDNRSNSSRLIKLKTFLIKQSAVNQHNIRVNLIVKYDLQCWEHYRLLRLVLGTSLDWVRTNNVSRTCTLCNLRYFDLELPLNSSDFNHSTMIASSTLSGKRLYPASSVVSTT